jgi:phosphinothricin acetyltransferase
MIDGIEANNAVSVALHKRAGFEQARGPRGVGRKFDRRLGLLFMRKQLSGLDPA